MQHLHVSRRLWIRRRSNRPWVLAMFSIPCLGAAPASAPVDVTSGDPQAVTITVRGRQEHETSQAIVVVPQAYGPAREAEGARSGKRFPVVYLLHGYGVGHTRYYLKFKETPRPLSWWADRYGVILVTPDGKPASWYMDAAEDSEDAAQWQIETRITRYVVPEVDRRFRTIATPEGRGITGISMGGHGAIYLAARHPELFGACSSMSGVMDLRDSMNKAPLAARLGSLEEHEDRWIEQSCITQAAKFAAHTTAILLDCGWDDPFYGDNVALHEKLKKLGVAHDYIERPGKHDWDYWLRALPYHLQFLTDRMADAE